MSSNKPPLISGFYYGVPNSYFEEAEELFSKGNNFKTNDFENQKSDTKLLKELNHLEKLRVRVFETFKNSFLEPQSVISICSGSDISPSEVFSNVAYLDIDSAALKRQKLLGYKTIVGSAEDYKPSDLYDLVVMLSPQQVYDQHLGVDTINAIKFAKEKGYIIVNEMYNTHIKLASLEHLVEKAGVIAFNPVKKDGSFSPVKLAKHHVFRKI